MVVVVVWADDLLEIELIEAAPETATSSNNNKNATIAPKEAHFHHTKGAKVAKEVTTKKASD